MSYSNVNNNSYFYLNVYFPRNPCPAATFVVLYRKCVRVQTNCGTGWRNGMIILNRILSIVFVIVCVFLSGVVLMQEGKDQGLGAIGGIADSYWGKIRGRSVEGTLEKLTAVAAVLFLALAFALNLIK